jgi:hypothetical protein
MVNKLIYINDLSVSIVNSFRFSDAFHAHFFVPCCTLGVQLDQIRILLSPLLFVL